MCRFVAYQGPERSADTLVFGGKHSLFVQSYRPRELLSGSVNADGYGVVWYDRGRPARLVSPFPIWHDVHLESVLRTVRSSTVVAALRNATPGIPVSVTAVPPLMVERWSFVLNGYVEDFRSRFMRAIHGWIPDAWFSHLSGASDTEALGLLAVAKGETEGSLRGALAAVVRTVAELVVAEGRVAQLNMVLTDGETVAVSRTSSGPEPNSLYVRVDRDGGALTASEPLDDDPAWKEVPPHTIVELRGGTAKHHPLPHPSA